jgi:Acyl-coenzyme A:6-aminopenicillanic acid acyl-transferase
MAVEVTEQQLGQLRWLVVRGPAREAFTSLGETLRTEIQDVVANWPDLPPLRAHVRYLTGQKQLGVVRHASQTRFPEVWAELDALATGAGADAGDLALMNFRGDLGVIEGAGARAGDGIGCSDLSWRRQRSLIAHNEDESSYFEGRCLLLTLLLDGAQPVTAYCKPGFLPSTAFTVTGSGLVWSIDHMQAVAPGQGAGRHFVARGLQLHATTVDGAIDYLVRNPSAGGYAYTIGDQAGRIVTVESSAEQIAWREAGGHRPLSWHTNHGQYVTGADPQRGGTSRARAAVLGLLEIPAREPTAEWFLHILTGAEPPEGVRAEPHGNSSAMTLCTFVADLTAGEGTILGRGADPVTLPLADLARGTSRAI